MTASPAWKGDPLYALPHAVAAAWADPPTRSRPLAEDLVDNHSRGIDALGLTSHPRELVEEMVRFASQGTAGWPSVAALLRTVGHRVAEPDRDGDAP